MRDTLSDLVVWTEERQTPEMMAEGSAAVPEYGWGMDRGSSRILWLLYMERLYCHDDAVYN